jgi:hypothetical protein
VSFKGVQEKGEKIKLIRIRVDTNTKQFCKKGERISLSSYH